MTADEFKSRMRKLRLRLAGRCDVCTVKAPGHKSDCPRTSTAARLDELFPELRFVY